MVQEKSVARRKLVVGNWKMNGLLHAGEALAKDIAASVAKAAPACEVVICPPVTLLMALNSVLAGTGVQRGAQDCHAKTKGAHTGDISAPMLKDLGCAFVIVGHSERRADHGETDAMVKHKASAALHAGITPIVCVGETEAERTAGKALDVVRKQIAGSIPKAEADAIVIAYEPIWAIGSGRIPTSPEIIEIHTAIRDAAAKIIAGGANVRILYGGSVKASNAAEVLSLEGVDGALVGGASLQSAEFCAIIQAAC